MSFLAIFAKIRKNSEGKQKSGHKSHFAYKEVRICGNEMLAKIYNSAQSLLFPEIAPGYKVVSWRNLGFFQTLRRVIRL